MDGNYVTGLAAVITVGEDKLVATVGVILVADEIHLSARAKAVSNDWVRTSPRPLLCLAFDAGGTSGGEEGADPFRYGGAILFRYLVK